MKINDYSFSDVLSNKSKKLKKNADERPYFDNTNEIIGLYKNPSLQTKEEEDDEEEEKEMKAGSGMSRLKQIYGGAKPTDPSLYSKAKQIADKTYSKPSAYKSGFIQKKYKEMGGEYKDDGKKPLKRWFKEDWVNIGKDDDYPVYRPTKRVSKDTALTVSEIDPKQAKEQIKLKQQIKDKANLPPFANKRLTSNGGNLSIPTAKNIKKSDPLYQVSNPTEVQKKAFQIYGKDAIIYKSDKANKKYQILNKLTGKMVHFGDTNYQDFQKHRDENRRRLYLGRATNMKGKWRSNPYSPNLLSISLLWNGENELV